MPYQKLWCVGELNDVLRSLILDYKFNRMRAAYVELAALLDDTVAQLPAGTIVTSVPTVRSHIRQRGYDHAALIAQEFARLRELHYSPVLSRMNTEMQRGASKKRRKEQAARAFSCKNELTGGTYLLIDDVLTTGATAESAAKVLRTAGADSVLVAVIAHQPLEKTSQI